MEFKEKNQKVDKILKKLGVSKNQKGCSSGGKWFGSGKLIKSYSPVDNSLIGTIQAGDNKDYEKTIHEAQNAFLNFRNIPAPQRGNLVRLLGNKIRENKTELGELVSWEMGKSLQEGLGEVQEMIDICDFAVGLSRQLYGLTMHSERPNHRMYEQYHPLGIIGIISAFNFPVAVWSWNTALAVVCGNSVIWKPSEKTPLTALACQHIFSEAINEVGGIPHHLSQLIIGNASAGKQLVSDTRVPVISATGSTAMGRTVGPIVAGRFGRAILELGGNNAIIACPSADLDLVIRATLFGAVGTAGQRCTSTRRLFVHDDIYETLMPALIKAYEGIKIGDPMDDTTLVGPLIDETAFNQMRTAIENSNGKVSGGERMLEDKYPDGFYVKPAIIEMVPCGQTVQEETFAPILYVYRFQNLDQAIAMHNDVPQGLSSAIFTNDIRESELFTSSMGSDCGIANVNIGTSGADIGGAVGGEKETGGGRESGSDAWKGYMRRSTNTVNYSTELPLAQGIVSNLDQD